MFKTLLVAIDSSPQCPAVLAQAAELAQRFGSALNVVSVHDLSLHWELGVFEPTPALFETLEADVNTTLAQAKAELAAKGLSCQTHAPVGMAAEQIARLARQLSADAIIIGHRQLSWLGRLVSKSVGWDLVARAPCSVLIVMEGDVTEVDRAPAETAAAP